jgi:hypothetical protein
MSDDHVWFEEDPTGWPDAQLLHPLFDDAIDLLRIVFFATSYKDPVPHFYTSFLRKRDMTKPAPESHYFLIYRKYAYRSEKSHEIPSPAGCLKLPPYFEPFEKCSILLKLKPPARRAYAPEGKAKILTTGIHDKYFED